MAKFILLFHGGKITKSKEAQSIKDRLTWMNDLKRQNKFVDGSPLYPEGKAIDDRPGVIEYLHNEVSINGYAIIKAKDMDEAIAIARTAPQVRKEYGAATAQIRELKPLN